MEATQNNQPTQPNQPQNAVQATQPAPVSLQCDFNTFAIARLTCVPPERKTIPGTGPEAKPPTPATYYYQIPLMYNYGDDENRVLNDFLIEGCEMDSKMGINTKTGISGRPEHSIMITFDANNEDHNRFLETMGNLYAGCGYILSQTKGVVKLPNFSNSTAQMSEATGLKHPVYRPRDEVTCELIQGRSPSMFLKLFSRGKPPMVEQTLFTGLDAKPIPWALLTGVELKFIPMIHVKRIHVGGGKASIQMEVVSAVVTSVRARNTSTRQTGTIERLQQNRPQLADQLAAQLAKLTADRQDQMLGVFQGSAEPAEQSGESQPTFSGVAPTGRPPAQGQYGQPNGGQNQYGQPNGGQNQYVPSISPIVSTPAGMQDFTGAAPPRIPVVGIPSAQMNSSPKMATVQLS